MAQGHISLSSTDGSNRPQGIQTRAGREDGREEEKGDGGYSLPISWVRGKRKWGRGAHGGQGRLGALGPGWAGVASPLLDLACSLTKSFRESKIQTKRMHA
jgi:hypothetical protein